LFVAPLRTVLVYGMMTPSQGEYQVAYRTLPGVSSPGDSVLMNDEPGYIC
jgi:hypothetical protein